MKRMLLVVLFGTTLAYAESSAFGAGDLSSNFPYGLTSSESLLKQRLDGLDDKDAQFNSKINELYQRIEGLQSTLEGINLQYARSNSRLDYFQINLQNVENNFSTQLYDLRAYLEENRKIQEANHKQIKKILTQLSSLVDFINANYVSKNELDDIRASIKENSVLSVNSGSNAIERKELKEVDDSWKDKNNNEILDLAIKDLNQNAYENSKMKLNYLIEKQYKPARANFWLGEIEYKQKHYNNAIVYYKKSSALSTKGDYFPKLLYHTAISLDKIGDTKTANGFYRALKANYPNSPEAKVSPNRK